LISEACHGTRSICGAMDLDPVQDTSSASPNFYDRYLRLSECESANNCPPLPLIPDLVSPRITSQVGRFTLHTHKRGGVIKFAKDLYANAKERRWYLVKIIIPVEQHRSILRSLRVAGVSMNITQDLDGIAEELLWRIRLGVDDRNPYLEDTGGE